MTMKQMTVKSTIQRRKLSRSDSIDGVTHFTGKLNRRLFHWV